MARATISAIAFFVLLSSAGCENGGGAAPQTASGEEFVLKLERGGSRESGTVTFTTLGKRTKVVLELDGRASRSSEPRPAHIHMGSCAELEPRPAYRLAAVADGKSTSTVAATLSDLRAGSFAVDVHESAADLQTHVACGELADARPRIVDPLGHDRIEE